MTVDGAGLWLFLCSRCYWGTVARDISIFQCE